MKTSFDASLLGMKAEIDTRMESIEKRLHSGTSVPGSMATLIMDGCEQLSFEGAKAWVQQIVADARLPPALEVYRKDVKEFKGMLFLKFGTLPDAEAALEVFKKQCLVINQRRGNEGREAWCNFDTPVQQRPMNGFFCWSPSIAS